MDILQLYSSYNESTNVGKIINRQIFNNVIDKYKTDNISIVSYDAFIISIDFLSRYYDNNVSFFEEIFKQKKPIIFVYSTENMGDKGLKYISTKYGIKFKKSDCSVLETNNWKYKPQIYGSDDEALSMSSIKFKGYCNIKNTNEYFVMKKDNIVIMHDLKLRFSPTGGIDTSGLHDMINTILEEKNEPNADELGWLRNIRICSDNFIQDKIDKNNMRINKLVSTNEILSEKLRENDYYKSILYLSGDKLVSVVKAILEEMLNIEINDDDEKKEDLFMKLGSKNILVEVKGVNHGFKRENIGQVKRHVDDYAEKNNIYANEIGKKCKGVLILNPYCKLDLSEKLEKEFYSKEVINDAKYYNVCTLDTFTLLSLYSKWKKNKKDVNIKELLVTQNYVEPNYMDIIDIR